MFTAFHEIGVRSTGNGGGLVPVTLSSVGDCVAGNPHLLVFPDESRLSPVPFPAPPSASLPQAFIISLTDEFGVRSVGHVLRFYVPLSPSQAKRLSLDLGQALDSSTLVPHAFVLMSSEVQLVAEELLLRLYHNHTDRHRPTLCSLHPTTSVTPATPTTPSATASPSPSPSPARPSSPSAFRPVSPASTLQHGCVTCAELVATHVLPVPKPLPGTSVTVSFGDAIGSLCVTVPDPSCLSDHGLEFGHVFQALSLDTVLTLWQAALLNRTVLLHSSHLKLLHDTASVLSALLFPLSWTTPFIPVLPASVPLTDMLDAPMSVLMGVPSCRFKALAPSALPPSAIVVDIDNSTCYVSGDHQVVTLPGKELRRLKSELQVLGADLFGRTTSDDRERALSNLDTGLVDIRLTDSPVPPSPRAGAGTDLAGGLVDWTAVRQAFFTVVAELLASVDKCVDSVDMTEGLPPHSSPRRPGFDTTKFKTLQADAFPDRTAFTAALVSSPAFCAFAAASARSVGGHAQPEPGVKCLRAHLERTAFMVATLKARVGGGRRRRHSGADDTTVVAESLASESIMSPQSTRGGAGGPMRKSDGVGAGKASDGASTIATATGQRGAKPCAPLRWLFSCWEE